MIIKNKKRRKNKFSSKDFDLWTRGNSSFIHSFIRDGSRSKTCTGRRCLFGNLRCWSGHLSRRRSRTEKTGRSRKNESRRQHKGILNTDEHTEDEIGELGVEADEEEAEKAGATFNRLTWVEWAFWFGAKGEVR